MANAQGRFENVAGLVNIVVVLPYNYSGKFFLGGWEVEVLASQ